MPKGQDLRVSAHKIANESQALEPAYICPSCYEINITPDRASRLRCQNCQAEILAVSAFRDTAMAWDAVYFGYMYGRVYEKERRTRGRKKYCLKAPDAVLVILGLFILKRVGGKVVDDVYDHLKPQLLEFVKKWKGTLQQRMIQGTRYCMERLERILQNEADLQEFIERVVSGLRSAAARFGESNRHG